MPHIIEITDLSAPELAPYTRLTEAQLRNKLEPERVSSSPKAPRSSARRWTPGANRSPF